MTSNLPPNRAHDWAYERDCLIERDIEHIFEQLRSGAWSVDAKDFLHDRGQEIRNLIDDWLLRAEDER